MADREDGLIEGRWQEFEQLRWEKSPDLREKFASFGCYWNHLQSRVDPSILVIDDLIILTGHSATTN